MKRSNTNYKKCEKITDFWKTYTLVEIMIRIARQFSTKVVTKKQVFFDTLTLRVIGGTGGRGVSSFQSIE